MAEATGLARGIKAEILVLHVIPSLPPPILDPHLPVRPTVPSENERCEAARSELADYLRKFVPVAVRSRGEIVLGEAALAIPTFAKTFDADLIVMATHGYGDGVTSVWVPSPNS